MCFSRITKLADVTEYARSYQSHHDTIGKAQVLVPFAGIVFSAGLLLHDLKAYAVNKIFVDKSLQGAFASITYSRVKGGDGQKTTSQNGRNFAILNIFTGGILAFIFLVVMAIVAISNCCCSSR